MSGANLPTSSDDPRDLYDLFREFFPARDGLVAYSDDIKPLLVQIKDHPKEIVRSRLRLIIKRMTIQKMNIERLMLGEAPRKFSGEYEFFVPDNATAEEMPLEECDVDDFEKPQIVQRLIEDRAEIVDWIQEILTAHVTD